MLKEESGDKNDYYYYSLKLNSDFVLISDESDEIVNSQWQVYCYEIDVTIKDIEDVQVLIGLFSKWSKY